MKILLFRIKLHIFCVILIESISIRLRKYHNCLNYLNFMPTWASSANSSAYSSAVWVKSRVANSCSTRFLPFFICCGLATLEISANAGAYLIKLYLRSYIQQKCRNNFVSIINTIRIIFLLSCFHKWQQKLTPIFWALK